MPLRGWTVGAAARHRHANSHARERGVATEAASSRYYSSQLREEGSAAQADADGHDWSSVLVIWGVNTKSHTPKG